MPRRLAIAISHAPGLRGTPSDGHCSSAATSASCARSSASPTSRHMRASDAISFGDSIRQTASIDAWTWVKDSEGSKGAMGSRSSKGYTPLEHLEPSEPLEPWELEAPGLFQSFHFMDLPDLDDLVIAHRRALGPLDRVFLGFDLNHPVP